MNIISEEIKEKQQRQLNEILRICEEWMGAYSLELAKYRNLFILKNEYGNTEVLAEDIDDILEYIADLIKMAMEKAEHEDYLNMEKDYKILTERKL